MLKRRKLRVGGPATVVTAAFIGPGTVTVCTITGAEFGLQLLWPMVLSIVMTITFQEMASRLGIVTRSGLTEIIKQELNHPVSRFFLLMLVVSAIVIGNGAYEAGNISGGSLGLNLFLKSSSPLIKFTPLLIGLIAFMILLSGNYKTLERILVGLVLLMSISFLFTAFLVKPDMASLIQGLFIPKIPENSLITILGLIGTTIVPYNLFLHASLSHARWNGPEDLSTAKRDTIFSILVGGLVSLAIIVTASALNGLQVADVTDIAMGLEPTYGSFAKYLVSCGFFAAGITSAITAPLAAAYVVAGCFGIDSSLTSWRFRITWMAIILIGVVFSSIGFKPVDIIRFAQAANGLLLPATGTILIWLCTKRRLLGSYTNGTWQTVVSVLFLVLVMLLGARSIWSV